MARLYKWQEPNQWSHQNRVLLPFLTYFMDPFQRTGMDLSIPFHTLDIFVFSRQEEQLAEEIAYFDLKTRVHR